jgi:hypothetical protein
MDADCEEIDVDKLAVEIKKSSTAMEEWRREISAMHANAVATQKRFDANAKKKKSTNKCETRLAILLLIGAQFWVGKVQAATLSRQRATGNWNSTFGWDPPGPPDSATDVEIYNGGTVQVT